MNWHHCNKSVKLAHSTRDTALLDTFQWIEQTDRIVRISNWIDWFLVFCVCRCLCFKYGKKWWSLIDERDLVILTNRTTSLTSIKCTQKQNLTRFSSHFYFQIKPTNRSFETPNASDLNELKFMKYIIMYIYMCCVWSFSLSSQRAMNTWIFSQPFYSIVSFCYVFILYMLQLVGAYEMKTFFLVPCSNAKSADL